MVFLVPQMTNLAIRFLFSFAVLFALPAMAKGLNGSEVLIVTGLAQESKISSGGGVVTICGCGNSRLLKERLAAIDPSTLRAVISFGIAGGLNPSLQVGQILLPRAIVSSGGMWLTSSELVTELKASLSRGPIQAFEGTVTGQDAISATPPAKAELYTRTGADAVDMESHIAAEYAESVGLPFAALRVISDRASQSLPPAATLPLKENGCASLLKVLGSLIQSPNQLPGLIQTALNAKKAFGVLQQSRSALNGVWSSLEQVP